MCCVRFVPFTSIKRSFRYHLQPCCFAILIMDWSHLIEITSEFRASAIDYCICSQVLWRGLFIDLCGVKTGVLRNTYVSLIAVNAKAHCITKPSITTGVIENKQKLLSSAWKDCNELCHLSVANSWNIQICFNIYPNTFSSRRVNWYVIISRYHNLFVLRKAAGDSQISPGHIECHNVFTNMAESVITHADFPDDAYWRQR